MKSFNTNEVAEQLGVTAEHVRKLIACGDLAAIDCRSKGATRAYYKIPQKALDDFREGRTVRLSDRPSRRRIRDRWTDNIVQIV